MCIYIHFISPLNDEQGKNGKTTKWFWTKWETAKNERKKKNQQHTKTNKQDREQNIENVQTDVKQELNKIATR